MFQELCPQDFYKTQSLFQAFDYSLSIRAALTGNNPGRIFVDNVAQPQMALALTVEGYLLAGDDSDPAARDAVRQFLTESIFTGQVFVRLDSWMSLAVYPGAWEARLPELIPTHEAEKVQRYHYLCRKVRHDWRAHVPAEYTVHPLAPILRGELDVHIPEELCEEATIESLWGTTENFLAKGAGFGVVHGDQVVSWCKANCVAGDQIEVGIVTLSEHRRRGLAAVVAAATVEHCLSHGFKAVSWQCDYDNVGSCKTAEKVGFEKAHEYLYYCYVYDLGDQLAQLGWRSFQLGEYEKCAQYYERSFPRQAHTPPSDYYYAAEIGRAWFESLSLRLLAPI